MPTKRDDFLDALLTRLQSVVATAERNYIRLLSGDLPALCMWDSQETANNVKYGKQSSSLQVNVAYAKDLGATDNASKIANEMIGQVIKYTISTDPTLSGAVESIKYQSSMISYPEPGGDWVIGVEVIFTVDYSTTLGNPYI